MPFIFSDRSVTFSDSFANGRSGLTRTVFHCRTMLVSDQ
jgi:hypothetical protein